MSEPAQVPSATVRPHTRSHSLPPYRGILAVDAKDFTGYPAIQHGEISRVIPQLLQTSFSRARLPEVWEERRFPDSTGDGYVFGFEPSSMPFVIHPWLSTLQELLTEFNVNSMGTVRIRLRASLHIGPLPDSGDDFDGNGTPRNDTHRLLDSVPVKAVLATQSENVTQVAAILSDRCYQDAVASGYTGRHPDYFIEVPASVEGKRFEQRAWLYVPAPSGNLHDPRILGEGVAGGSHEPEDHRAEREALPQRTAAPSFRADRGIVNGGHVEGGQTVNNVEGGQTVNHVEDGGRYIGGDHVGGDSIGGDYVGGNKAGTVHGNQGDTVHGDKSTATGRPREDR
ncbi:hypothetical protein E0L36_17730 [Streptomyces sp. AJS327]|uniref:hypothetical protein n=1 Tax=Streptomyces sp. AJS327 TaxID=2545265 RepID=UPI0015DF24CC|nr:hypothetical protein [Streptomyces sp. AJS327]MBA0052657.1 hypothetical protein [Streptomyces sp. AJS327]